MSGALITRDAGVIVDMPSKRFITAARTLIADFALSDYLCGTHILALGSYMISR